MTKTVLAQQGQPARQAFDLSQTTIPREQIRGGGPPKDGIPALTNPKYVTADQPRFLRPTDRIAGVVINEDARAFPLRILEYHEAVNDQIGGVPVAVTYCPLCDSVVVFDRRVGDDVVELGVSGLLNNSNVLLYDRRRGEGECLISQIQTEGVSGPRARQKLQTLPVEVTTWADWVRRHRDTKVLSTDTGYDRDYRRSPYEQYFRSPQLMFPVQPTSDRLPRKERVLGVWMENASRAYPLSAFAAFRESREFPQELAGRKFTLAWNPEAKSLRVIKADEGLEWMYAFWFAWYAFHPETEFFNRSP